MMSYQDPRVQAIAMRVVEILEGRFGHSGDEARALFEAFHVDYSNSGGWAPADYYDHEGPQALALEIEFHHQFSERPRRGKEFLEWRKSQWR